MAAPTLAALLAVFGAALLASFPRAAGAELWIWERDFYVHASIPEDYVRGSLARANRYVQEQNDPEDTPCPVELRIRRLVRYDGRTAGMVERPESMQLPADPLRPGFYFHNGRSPSFTVAQAGAVSLWVYERKKDQAPSLRLERTQGWSIAHEWGHAAGLAHIFRSPRAPLDDPATPENERKVSDQPCSLMSYNYGFGPGQMGVSCQGASRLVGWQCEAYKKRADRFDENAAPASGPKPRETRPRSTEP